MGVTDGGSARWFRSDLDPALVIELEALCGSHMLGPESGPEPVTVERFVHCLARRGAVLKTWTGPAFRFPDELPRAGPTVHVTQANAEVLRPYFEDWLGDVSDDVPMVAVLKNGIAVSLCSSVRLTAGADQAGVETHPDLRGHGYGATATVAWAMAVRELGRIPLYSTSWDNLASRALARSLSLVQFSADLHIT